MRFSDRTGSYHNMFNVVAVAVCIILLIPGVNVSNI